MKSEKKFIDCSKWPSEENCDLKMIGSEEHLLPAAVQHSVTAHGHEDTPKLREELRGLLEPI